MWSETPHRGPAPQALLRAGAAAVVLVVAAAALASRTAGIDPLAYAWLLPPCPLRAVTGLPCPGCGMTRALLLLAQLRLHEALASNPAAPALLVAVTCVALRGGRRRYRLPAAVAGVALAAVLASWASRVGAAASP